MKKRPRWAFVMEPKRCIDCEACMVACSVENNVPIGHHRNWIAHYEKGSYPDVSLYFAPENCHHCTNPPCERVCPTGATYRREDGLVLIDYDRCIGCRYCMQACPYDARYFRRRTGRGGQVHVLCASPGRRRTAGLRGDMCGRRSPLR